MKNKYFHILLNYIFSLGASVNSLADPNANYNFNRPHHGLKKMRLFKELIEMQASGFIEFRDNSDLQLNNISATDLKIHGNNIFVFLTKNGGYEWEKIFEPDWSKYILDYHEPHADGSVEVGIEAGSVDTANYVEEILYKAMCPITKKSILSPWKPTYWKIMNEGYLIEFKMPSDTSRIVVQLKSDLPWRKSLESVGP